MELRSIEGALFLGLFANLTLLGVSFVLHYVLCQVDQLRSTLDQLKCKQAEDHESLKAGVRRTCQRQTTINLKLKRYAQGIQSPIANARRNLARSLRTIANQVDT